MLGVNLVILFDKRVRYVKKVKNHCSRLCSSCGSMRIARLVCFVQSFVLTSYLVGEACAFHRACDVLCRLVGACSACNEKERL